MRLCYIDQFHYLETVIYSAFASMVQSGYSFFLIRTKIKTFGERVTNRVRLKEVLAHQDI